MAPVREDAQEESSACPRHPGPCCALALSAPGGTVGAAPAWGSTTGVMSDATRKPARNAYIVIALHRWYVSYHACMTEGTSHEKGGVAKAV